MKIGLLGFGTVGGGIGDIVMKRPELSQLLGEKVEIVAALVKDVRDHVGTPFEGIVTEDVDRILENPEIEVVFEALGGIDVPYSYISRALKHKKHVITANKAVICAHYPELKVLAEENGVVLSLEACVGGGIPILSTLNDHLLFGETKGIHGILNGTGNYILSKIEGEGCSFESALAEAQALGYAEQIPDDDVDGFDATRKLLILTALIHNQFFSLDQVWIASIRNVSPADFELLAQSGKTLRYVVSCERDEKGGLHLAARPAVVAVASAFGQTFGPDNTVVFEHSHLNQLSLKGPGAGKLPTANAMLGDLVRLKGDIARKSSSEARKLLHGVTAEGVAKQYYVRSGDTVQYVTTDAPKVLLAELLEKNPKAFIAEVL